MELHRTEI